MSEQMKTEEVLAILAGHPLFRGTDLSAVGPVVRRSLLRSAAKGEQLNADGPALYCLLKGRARVLQPYGKRSVVLNTLSACGVFGVAQLFGNEPSATSVVASAGCVVLRIGMQDVEKLLKTDYTFARNYIVFLSDRIRFLNRRIAAFTAGDSEHVLASYLLSLPDAGDGKEIPLPALASLASALNMSRPTLYRAFDVLSETGAARKNGNAVKILNRKKLEEIKKGNLS